MSRREPVFNPVAIADLRPTQITVGYREVAARRRRWREHAAGDGPEFLGRHMIPVLKGPKGRHYVLDHHHLCRALLEEGVGDIAVNVILDLSRLSRGEFWTFCDSRGWCHPYDAAGVRKSFDHIPHAIADMADDPYRSLAGELRRVGGYAKDTTPFAEFVWADFLRRRIKPKLLADDFIKALDKAMALAKSERADHLPGWCGPVDVS
jgi:hypothetical protein